MKFVLFAIVIIMLPICGQCEAPRNIYGAHLLTANTGTRGLNHLKWARSLVGKYGYVKTLMMGVTSETQAPSPGWVDWVNQCYKMDMIPVCRLAGVYSNDIDGWVKPQPDADGCYESIAQAVKRVVQGLPRSDKYPLYIEVWNEPNLNIEWSGKSDVAEYARFFVDVSRAIRSIGDKRIKIMNGAFGLSPKSTEICCQTDLDFINAFDVWASHPYPQNQPPENNVHNGTAIHDRLCIDGYLAELEVLKKYGRKDIKVMLTETGYALGEDVFTDSNGFPPVDELNRADYMLRAYRDYWEKWPEIVAVIPFEFADAGWEQFNWVYPQSGTLTDGRPTKPHYQYTLISKLAKSTDPTGTISGNVTDSQFGAVLMGVTVSIPKSGVSAGTDAYGNYILPDLAPGSYRLTATSNGFAPAEASADVQAGKNTVVNFKLTAVNTGSVSGRVIDSISGHPVQGAVVTLIPGGVQAITDEFGSFTIKGLSPITYTAQASAEKSNIHKASGITIKPGRDMFRLFRITGSKWPQADNACSNPSFELLSSQGTIDSIAARWEVQSGRGVYKVITNIAHSGDRCQAVSATQGEAALRMISHYNYAKPGATYTAGVWVKTNGLSEESGESAYLSLDFQDNGGAVLQSMPSQNKISGTTGWTYLEVTAVAPQCQRISVVLHANTATGTAYFDDAYLGLVSPTP